MEPIQLGDDEPLLWNASGDNVIAMFQEPVTYFARSRRLIFRKRHYRMINITPDGHSLLLREIPDFLRNPDSEN